MTYFRIYLTRADQVEIVQMSECDEIDYNQSRFLSDRKFDTDVDAIDYLQNNSDRLSKSIYNPYSQEFSGSLD